MQIGTHIGIPGLGASPSPGPLPGETIDTDNELMSLISWNRPYVVLLDPTSVSIDSATRLHAHCYAGDE